ncbi:MAG: hypothetical protein ACP5H8_03965, partial [Candidatus Micrarchaeia archaeon]
EKLHATGFSIEIKQIDNDEVGNKFCLVMFIDEEENGLHRRYMHKSNFKTFEEAKAEVKKLVDSVCEVEG